MKVIVYVEGPSDRAAMDALLESLIARKRQEGVAIEFHPALGKQSLIEKVPLKAALTVRNDPGSFVVAMPDLYPKNEVFLHATVDEMIAGITQRFEEALEEKCDGRDERLLRRFRVFCFKHDLEALLLAAEDALKSCLSVRSLKTTWRRPVEEQDFDNPPKRIVERLFAQNGDVYDGVVDAPMILRGCNYRDIAERCPQCFKPFVEFLENVSEKDL